MKTVRTGTKICVTVSENFTFCFSPGCLPGLLLWDCPTADLEGRGGGGWGGISVSASLELPGLSLSSLPEQPEHDEWEQRGESEKQNLVF